MTNQLALCAYQNDVNKPKYERLCDELTILQERAIPPSLQKLIAGYAVEVTCMSCRQVKKQGAPALEIAMTFFKENLLILRGKSDGRLLRVLTREDPSHPGKLPFTHVWRDEPAEKFDLFIENSWRYSLYNLYTNTYCSVAVANPNPPEPYEERICFHLLTAKCVGQHPNSRVPGLTYELEDAMREERDAVTKELVKSSS